jgi:hypothetical protein
MNTFFNFIKQYFDKFNKTVLPNLTNNMYFESYGTKHTNVIPNSIQFLSPILQQQINTNSYWRRTYHIQSFNTLTTLNIYSASKKQTQDNNIIFVAMFILYYCHQVKGTTQTINLQIDIILSSFKKRISQGKPLDQYNINSGVTSFAGSTNDLKILIFRREEVAKVLIHELLHALRMDDAMQPLSSDTVSLHFGSTTSLNINESFTETYASLLNLVLATLAQDKGISYFRQLLRKESLFLKHQASKVLSSIGFNTNDGKLLLVKDYKETTNIISYYILKYINFKNIDDFCDFLLLHKFELKNINDYIKFLEKHILQHKWSKLTCKYDTTLRMSSVDLIDILGGTYKAYKTFYR